MSDNMYDIDRLLSNGRQASGAPLILPGAGLFCGECGFEVKRLPDGRTSDTVFFTLGGIETPHYHMPCAQGALMARDAAYLAGHVRSLEPRGVVLEVAGECCLRDHANATAPWTCPCGCHTEAADAVDAS